MQTENLANNSHKQFYVLLNTNRIKLVAIIKLAIFLFAEAKSST